MKWRALPTRNNPHERRVIKDDNNVFFFTIKVFFSSLVLKGQKKEKMRTLEASIHSTEHYE
jgi:hypothetical protein